MSGTNRIPTWTHGRVPRLSFLALVVLSIVVNGIFALVVLHQLRQIHDRVERSLQSTLVMRKLDRDSQKAGQYHRSYRVSGDPDYLTRYREEDAHLPGDLEELRRLVDDNAAQSALLDKAATLIDRDRRQLAATLSPVQSNFGLGQMPPGLAASMALTNQIAEVLGQLQNNERDSLIRYLNQTESGNTILLCTVILGGVGSLVLAALIFRMMLHEVRRSARIAQANVGALEESELRFRRIFEQSPLGILLMSRDERRITQANPAFCRMVGYDAAHIAGREIAEITHIDDRELAKSVDGAVELRYISSSAMIVWARVSVTQLSTSDERQPMLLALVVDITREKRAEAELRQAQKMEAVGQLTGGIAHDFNNLLGVIIGNAEFLLDAVRGTIEGAMLAQEILDSAMSGADLTRRLLAFARRQPLQPRLINLNEYLPNHIAMLRRLLGETIQINMRLAEELWPTRADSSQVGDALLNLVINARDAMPHGGSIAIRTANVHVGYDEFDIAMAPGEYVVLSVTDSGAGMAPEVLERAIEPFFTTKGPGAGSGLGLSMIFGFAKQSGGHLDIASQSGHGTTVRLYLPRAQRVDTQGAADAPDITLPTGQENILLVDDNVEMRLIARRHLASLGYRVGEASCGSEALDLLRHDDAFDLLFTDVVMPGGMNGYQLASAAREVQPGLRVLFTTGYVRLDRGAGELPPGAMLRKPYRKQELATMVRTALDA